MEKHIACLCFTIVTFLFFNSCGQRAVETGATYANPILAGFYPDPSLCRVGDDYYLVTSTFSYYPGVPIFHSRDLLHWQQIGYVLDRPEQLDLDGLGVSRGIFAPAIRHHGGVFYLTTTLVDGGGNFVVTAANPAGPWSNPSWLPDVVGIDPSLFFDEGGKAYIIFNGEPPEGRSLYDGHRALWLYGFDTASLTTVGPRILVVNGGTDISQKPIWIEGPHIFKKGGFYYLIAAEGGTGYDHSEVVFRATDVTGPYTSYSANPILTQRHLDPKRENPITCTGHADLVETQNGQWWAVFLGCRPYDSYFFNTGRETFMAPVRWTDGWPVINPDAEEVQYSYQGPDLPSHQLDTYPLNGNFTLRDEFDADTLALYWMFLRTLREEWYSLTRSPGRLSLQLRPEMIYEKANPSFIGRRQQHLHCGASLALDFTPNAENETAGIIAFQNETHYYYLGKTLVNGTATVQLKNHENILAEIALAPEDGEKPLYLKIEARAGNYDFYYATTPGSWQKLAESVDGKVLSTEVAGGFVGAFFGMYAGSQGKPSTNYANFDWFEYRGFDETFERKEVAK